MDANPRFTVPLILLSCFGSGITVFLLWGLAAGTPPGLLVFGTIYGIFSGGFSSLWAGMIRQVGSESSFIELRLSSFSFFLLELTRFVFVDNS